METEASGEGVGARELWGVPRVRPPLQAAVPPTAQPRARKRQVPPGSDARARDKGMAVPRLLRWPLGDNRITAVLEKQGSVVRPAAGALQPAHQVQASRGHRLACAPLLPC